MSNDEIRQHLRAYQRAVTSDPANVVLRRRLAGYLRELGYLNEAVRELELCSKLLAARGELIGAIACSKELLKIDPAHTDILLFLSRHYADHPALQRKERVVAPVGAEGTSPGGVVRGHTATTEAPVGIGGRLASGAEDIDLTVVTFDGDDDEDLDISVDISGLPDLPTGPPPAPTSPPVLQRRDVPDTSPLTMEPGSLAAIPLFSTLPPDAFVALVQQLQVKHVAAGALLETVALVETVDPVSQERLHVREPALQIVVHGSVTGVLQAEAPVDLGAVEEGGFFGEFELLTSRPHDVMWRADSDTELLILPKSVLDELVRAHPAIGRELWTFYKNRLVLGFLASSTLFKTLDVSERESLAQQFTSHSLDAGDLVAAEGQQSDGFYLVRDGAMEVFVRGGEPIYELRPGDVFGVHAVASGEPFSASVRATEPTTILVLRAAVVAQLMMLYPSMKTAFDVLAEERVRLAQPLVVGETDYSRGGFSTTS